MPEVPTSATEADICHSDINDSYIEDSDREIACVGAVVFDARSRLLVVQRGTPPAIGEWSIPGGRIEPGETVADALVREVYEETGLVVTAGRELGTVRRRAPITGVYLIHDLLAYLTADSRTDPVAGDDALSARWVTRAELASLSTVAGLVEALTSWDALPS